VAAWADPATMRTVLAAAGTLLDGRAAAPSTIRRNRTILHNALEYAVERRLLTRNAVKAIKWKAPKLRTRLTGAASSTRSCSIFMCPATSCSGNPHLMGQGRAARQAPVSTGD
jgi:hypothetical protein